MWHFGSGWCTPPPRNAKVGFQVKVTFVVLDDVPPRNEKVGSQVNVTYWFWMMYLPPLTEINMNAIENNWGQQVLFTNLPPPSPTHSIILFYAWTGNWWISISIGYGYMDSNPICHPLQPKKLNVHFWIIFNFWWSAKRSKQKTSTKMQKTKKAP